MLCWPVGRKERIRECANCGPIIRERQSRCHSVALSGFRNRHALLVDNRLSHRVVDQWEEGDNASAVSSGGAVSNEMHEARCRCSRKESSRKEEPGISCFSRNILRCTRTDTVIRCTTYFVYAQRECQGTRLGYHDYFVCEVPRAL